MIMIYDLLRKICVKVRKIMKLYDFFRKSEETYQDKCGNLWEKNEDDLGKSEESQRKNKESYEKTWENFGKREESYEKKR